VAARVLPDYEFELEAIGGGVIASGDAVFEGIQVGLMEMSEFQPGWYPDKAPLSYLSTFPVVPDDVLRANQTLSEYFTSPLVAEELAQWNAISLFALGVDPQELILTFPAEGLDDLVGKKIRLYGIYQTVYDRLGVSAVSFPSSEVYEGLQRGTIDGAITGWPTSHVSRSHHEVSTDALVMGLGPAASGYLINLDAWNALPTIVQDAMRAEAGCLPIAAGKYMLDYRASSFKTLEDAGITIRRAPLEDREKFMETLFELIEEEVRVYDERGVPASEGWATFKEIIERWS